MPLFWRCWSFRLVAILSIPPLVLISAFVSKESSFLKTVGLAAAGPAVAGVSLGASAPLVLLYVMTGFVDVAFALLIVVVFSLALVCGARGALQNARRAGDASPGSLLILMHYGFTIWTSLVSSITVLGGFHV